MFGDDIIVRTRLMPPRLPRRWLRRARLDRLLAVAVDYSLTLVSASAGYGKSSALASFAARGGWPTIWYGLAEGGDDPLIFLLHLIHACRAVVPHAGERALTLLQQPGHHDHFWSQALDVLINDLVARLDDETILVIDDYHAVDDLPEIRLLIERLILQRPPLLHVVLATRRWPQLACLPTLRVRGDLYEIGETELAFTDEEIAALFLSAYERVLNPEQAHAMSEQTGGWAIALQLIWQGVRGLPALDPDVTSMVVSGRLGPESREALFAYLAQEVLTRQPHDIQSFLLRSSVLAELQPAACDQILNEAGAVMWIRKIYRLGLFMTALGGDVYRYHPLFHAFLQQRARATLPDWEALHRRAADYYRSIEAGDKVLYHLLAIGKIADAAQELEHWTRAWLRSGRAVTVLTWLEQLPDAALVAHPQLLIARGDAARLLARFDQALRAYAEAERIGAAIGDPLGESRALQGQALVYLDTVQPTLARGPLMRAYRLLPRANHADRAALLGMIAENWLNLGRVAQAARLYRSVARRVPLATNSQLYPRILLRLGQLHDARVALEAALLRGVAHDRPPEAHREITVLLSFVCALQGDAESALRYAQRGIETARRLGSALLEAIAHIRIGHAMQLLSPPDHQAVNQHYLQAIALADAFNVPRTKVEAYMGMVLLHGFGGDMGAAQAAAQAGRVIIEPSGDIWSTALLWGTLGAVGIANRAPEAQNWLQEALDRYQISNDTYGQALVYLWMAIGWHRAGKYALATAHALHALMLAQQHGYDGLLTKLTLFGPRDRMMLIPVLLAGRDEPQLSASVRSLLARGFPAIAADDVTQHYHPGATLRIQTFGQLRVWRGVEEIESREWQRKKARQLLAYLITNRHRWILREQICDWFWPDDDPVEAETQFKVTLNALNTALEPARPPRTPPFYIRRQGGAYRFCPPDGIWIDVEEFEMRIAATRAFIDSDSESLAVQEELATAVQLYQDDYLSDYLYEEWTREERERLLARYLETATRLAELLFNRHQLPEAIQICDMILTRDPCWEEVYGLLMRAYDRQGNRRQALATYERCVRNLRTHLDVAPLPQTIRIYEEIKA